MPRRRRKVKILETEKKNRPALESGFMGNPVGITMPDAVGLRGTAGRAFLPEKESIAYGDGSYEVESDVEATEQHREAEPNAGNTNQNREAESNAGDTDQNRKAEPSAGSTDRAELSDASSEEEKPLWCTSAEQYPLRGSMSFRQAAEL